MFETGVPKMTGLSAIYDLQNGRLVFFVDPRSPDFDRESALESRLKILRVLAGLNVLLPEDTNPALKRKYDLQVAAAEAELEKLAHPHNLEACPLVSFEAYEKILSSNIEGGHA